MLLYINYPHRPDCGTLPSTAFLIWKVWGSNYLYTTRKPWMVRSVALFLQPTSNMGSYTATEFLLDRANINDTVTKLVRFKMIGAESSHID